MALNSMDVVSSLNKSTIRSLRLRLGWSQADLARRLKCTSAQVKSWEHGTETPTSHYLNEMFLLVKQADTCSHEIHACPLAENMCDRHALGQIEFSQIKEEIE
ncbi:MAG TPA: helix-turn-helix transcriptional regulator [Pseudobdellovibrionaceae bacterium]